MKAWALMMVFALALSFVGLGVEQYRRGVAVRALSALRDSLASAQPDTTRAPIILLYREADSSLRVARVR